MRDKTLLEQLQFHLNWRRIGNTHATVMGFTNDRPAILLVRDSRQAQMLVREYGGNVGDMRINHLHVKTIFAIPELHGYQMPVLIDHFALSDLITQHTAAINKYWREKLEEVQNVHSK